MKASTSFQKFIKVLSFPTISILIMRRQVQFHRHSQTEFLSAVGFWSGNIKQEVRFIVYADLNFSMKVL